MKILLPSLLATVVLGLSGCATIPPKDYTAFRQHRPGSILVLPAVNRTVEVNAGYSVVTATSRPLSELGYYVFPVNVVDQFMKENGVTVPEEMQQIPLEKLRATFAPDAVLYLTVEKYGSKYQVLSSNTFVSVSGQLVDARSGTVLWKGRIDHQQAGNSGLLEAIVDQIVNKLLDSAHMAAQFATAQLFTVPEQGLLKGPHHPEFAKVP